MKKRSLLAATAMLLVALLVATGSTFAWFTSTSTAKASVSMGVATGSSLEISNDRGTTWKSSITYAPEEGELWQDFSTNEDALGTFYKATFEDDSVEISGYETGTPASVTLNFRSTKSSPILLKGSIADQAFETTQDDLVKWSEIVVKDNTDGGRGTQIFSNNTNIPTKAIVHEGENNYTTDGTYTTTALTTSTEIVELTDGNDGYYYGAATFYFFIEGTETDNGDINGIGDTAKILANLNFAQ